MIELDAFKALPPEQQEVEIAASRRRLKATQEFFAQADRLDKLKAAERRASDARNSAQVALALAHDECIAAQAAGGDPKLVPRWLDSLYGPKRHNTQ